MLIDLHMHSTFSDGSYTPSQLVHIASQAGVSAMALTDHDSLQGLVQAACAAREIAMPFLQGIELSVGAQREIHLLGYGVRVDDTALEQFCADKKAERVRRMEQMVALLQKEGIEITLEEVRVVSGGGILSRSHVARVLADKGVVSGVKAAFEKYLNPGRVAYVPRSPVSVEEACAMLRASGAIPVLAHPFQLKLGWTALCSLIEEWQSKGLEGVEVYHPSHQANHTAQLERFARAHGLLVTGGSDYHGEHMRPTGMAQGVERWRLAAEDTQRLFERVSAHGREGNFPT